MVPIPTTIKKDHLISTEPHLERKASSQNLKVALQDLGTDIRLSLRVYNPSLTEMVSQTFVSQSTGKFERKVPTNPVTLGHLQRWLRWDLGSHQLPNDYRTRYRESATAQSLICKRCMTGNIVRRSTKLTEAPAKALR